MEFNEQRLVGQFHSFCWLAYLKTKRMNIEACIRVHKRIENDIASLNKPDTLIASVMNHWVKHFDFPSEHVSWIDKEKILRGIWLLYIRNSGLCPKSMLSNMFLMNLVENGQESLKRVFELCQKRESHREGVNVRANGVFRVLIDSSLKILNLFELSFKELEQLVRRPITAMKVNMLITDGYEYYKRQEYEKALSTFAQSLQFEKEFENYEFNIYELFIHLLVLRGMCYVHVGDYIMATKDFTKGLMMKKESVSVQITFLFLKAMSSLLLRDSKHVTEQSVQESLKDLVDYIRNCNHIPKCIELESVMCYSIVGTILHRFELIQGTCAEILDKCMQKHKISILHMISAGLHTISNPKRMEQDLHHLVDMFPSSLSFAVRAYHYRTIDENKALQDCEMAIKMENNPSSQIVADMLALKGLVYQYTNPKLSLEYFTKSINLMDDVNGYRNNYYNRGCVYLQLEMMEEAARDFDRAIEIQPNDYQAYLNAATALIAINKIDKAIEYVDKAIQINPKYPNCWFKKGALMCYSGHYASAIQNYKIALKLAEEMPGFWCNKRACVKAIKTCTKLIGKQPTHQKRKREENILPTQKLKKIKTK